MLSLSQTETDNMQGRRIPIIGIRTRQIPDWARIRSSIMTGGLDAALLPDLSIEERPIPDTEDGHTSDAIVTNNKIFEVVISSLFLYFPWIWKRKSSIDWNWNHYCSAGATQRCNFCDNEDLHWRKCANNHRVSPLSLWWLESLLTDTLYRSRTGHWCSWSDANGVAVCS